MPLRQRLRQRRHYQQGRELHHLGRVARDVGREGCVLSASNGATHARQREEEMGEGKLCHPMSSSGISTDHAALCHGAVTAAEPDWSTKLTAEVAAY